jgi:hypothetical protein
MAIPTTDQLRADIDAGRTGEKVAHPDPAAAPLGTDDEAAGNSPTIRERSIEAAAREIEPHRQAPNGVIIYGMVIVAVVVAVAAVWSLI